MCLELFARNAPNSYKQKTQWMDANSNKINTLILGTSHMYFGIDPKYFDKPAYNLANVSQPWYYDNFLLKKYIGKSKKLKYVVCELAYFTPWADDLENGGEWYRVIYYQIYMGCKKHSMFSKYNFEISYTREFSSKILESINRKEDTNCSKLGQCTSYSITRRSLQWYLNTASIKRHTHNKDISIFKKNIHEFYDIAEICKRRNIKIILISTPCMPIYYNKLNKEQLKAMYMMARIIKEKFPNTVCYYDLLRNPQFKPNDYYDIDHLNRENGAPKLSIIVNHIINSIDAKTGCNK